MRLTTETAIGHMLKAGETVYCRYTGEPLTVIESDGVIVVLKDSNGKETGRIIGDIFRRRAA